MPGEEEPKFEPEVDLPPASPNTEADQAIWEEYNKKHEEWKRRQTEKENLAGK